jgi:hypothetical protein
VNTPPAQPKVVKPPLTAKPRLDTVERPANNVGKLKPIGAMRI